MRAFSQSSISGGLPDRFPSEGGGVFSLERRAAISPEFTANILSSSPPLSF
jgi:hypothetical protein